MMYREPAKMKEKPVKIVLTFNEVRNICVKYLQDTGRMPKEADLVPFDLYNKGTKHTWYSGNVPNPNLNGKLDADLIDIEFRIKAPSSS